jgi:uncharacterized protein YjbI with pentapeptide repeats
MEEKGAVHDDKVFDKVDYQDKVVSDRTFSRCTFTNCNLSKTIFEDCVFEHCTFDKCDLSLMKVKGCSFSHIQISNSKAIGILWFDAKAPFIKNPFTIAFTDSVISYSSFYGLNLKKGKFVRCIAKEVDFSECNLLEANMEGTDLVASRFINCDLSGANFNNARNYSIDVRSNKVKKAKFSMPDAMSLLDSLDIIVE